MIVVTGPSSKFWNCPILLLFFGIGMLAFKCTVQYNQNTNQKIWISQSGSTETCGLKKINFPQSMRQNQFAYSK